MDIHKKSNVFIRINGVIQQERGWSVKQIKIRLNRLKDRIGRETQLLPFESFWMYLDAEGSLTLHGCGKLITCTDSEIAVECIGRITALRGTRLQVRALGQREMEVSGNIEQITFTKNREME